MGKDWKIKEMEAAISEGESQWTEFKESPNKDLATEICGFANTTGGRIFIGVDDHGRIVGTDTGNAARSRIQDMINHIEPSLNAVLEVHDNIIVIIVPEGKEKPYFCSRGLFKRSGTITQKLDRDEMIEFLQTEDIIRYDTRVRNEYKVKDKFNETAYKKFIRKAGISDALPPDHILTNLKCAVLNDDGELVFTNAGALFFRDNTEDVFFSYARIVCVLFKGSDKVKVIDAQEFGGSILDNIDNAVAFLWKNLRVRHEIKGLIREDVLEIPEDALREAVTNAVCHRNYFEYGTGTTVEIFDDRVEIYNPGGIPKGLKESDFGKKSVPRNPIIANLLHRAGYVEEIGTGIKKMRDAMSNAGLEVPTFESTSFFTTVFKRPPARTPSIEKMAEGLPIELLANLTENEIKICELISEDDKITADIMSQQLEISKSTVYRSLKSLTEKRIIIRIGTDKSGSWKFFER
jgi:ATP-dependent DNA helicase RecG